MTKQRLNQVRERIKTPAKDNRHIGLSNTYRRLYLLYGEEFELIIRSKKGWGTSVQICIPLDRLEGEEFLSAEGS